MANFPTSLPSITNPNANDTLAAVPHHTQHSTANDEIAAIATKVGTGSSTPTADKVLAGTGTGTSGWTATPTLTGLTLGTAERSLVIGSGTELWWYAGSTKTSGTVASISKGTQAAPDTSTRPMVKLNQTIEVTNAGDVTGDGAEELAALNVSIDSTAATVRQPIAVLGQARTRATPGSADATAGYFRGESLGYGRGIGSFHGGVASSANAAADGMQIVTYNGTGSNHAVHPTGIATTTGIWLCAMGANDQRCGVGIQIGNGFGAQFDVAFHVNGQTSASPTATVQTASVANPTVITTTAAHDLLDGDQIVITGSNSTPSIDGTYTITRTGASTFTIPVNVTVQGTAGSITGRKGAALTAAFRDDSFAKSSIQVRGSHSTAAINLSESVGGLSMWLPAYDSSTNNGVIAATNIAGNGTTRLAYYTTLGVLNLGAETSINSLVFHTFTAGGVGIGKTTTTGLLALNNASNGYVRVLDYNGSLLTLGAGAEASGSPGIYSAKYHSFGAGIYIGAGNITTDTTTGTKIGTATNEKLGFWNATPVVKGSVTGSRGGNAALASLLTLLASYGLLTDSSS